MIIEPKVSAQLISTLKAAPLILYGMGGASIHIAKWCDENEVDYVFADQDIRKRQTRIDKIVVSPERLRKDYPNANIVISSIIYYDEIEKKLLRLGIDQKHILSYDLFMKENVTWEELEHNTKWGEHIGRVKMISEWVSDDAQSVADYGEGKLSIKNFINPNIKYYPIDYIMRSNETILCDFNKDQFPKLQTDISVCTATLVFITKADSLLNYICKNTSRIIILSYVTADIFSNIKGRRASGYVNDFTEEDIVNICLTNGFTLKEKRSDPANKIDTLFLFEKTKVGEI
ncbi:MAG: hypothetical protein AB9836_13265 [Aminipila sp.]